MANRREARLFTVTVKSTGNSQTWELPVASGGSTRRMLRPKCYSQVRSQRGLRIKRKKEENGKPTSRSYGIVGFCISVKWSLLAVLFRKPNHFEILEQFPVKRLSPLFTNLRVESKKFHEPFFRKIPNIKAIWRNIFLVM